MSFGSELRKIRLEKNLTVNEMADKMNMNANLLRDIEAGRKPPFKKLRLMQFARVNQLDKDTVSMLCDEISKERNVVPYDIEDFLISNKAAREKIRRLLSKADTI